MSGRDGRGEGLAGTVWRDLRHAVRLFSRQPGFAFLSVSILAIGIGATTTFFSALSQAVLSAPPYPEAERMVLADITVKDGDNPADPLPWSYPKFEILRDTVTTLSPVAAYYRDSVTLFEGEARVLDLEFVTSSYFPLLGVEAVRGRTLAPEDDVEGSRSVVISHALWRDLFGGEAAVLGRDIVLDNRPMTVVGIAPAGFDGLTGGARAWAPIASIPSLGRPGRLRQRQAHWFQVVGKLAPGASLESAREEARGVGLAIAEAIPPDGPAEWTWSVGLVPLAQAREHPGTRASLVTLFAAVVVLLLTVCANVAGLLVAKSASRRREVAIRSALGATRPRLLRQFLTESLLLSLAGGALGVVVAVWGIELLGYAIAESFGTAGTRTLEFIDAAALGLSPGVLLFAVCASVLTGAICGVLPALQISRRDVAEGLVHGEAAGRAATGGTGARGLAALAVQIGLSFVLLAGAGLLVRSLVRLEAVPLGFDPAGLLTIGYAIPSGDAAASDPAAFHDDLIDRIAALPGARGATLGCLPAGGRCDHTRVIEIAGHPPFEEGREPGLGIQYIGDAHFALLGAPLLKGRELSRLDRAGTPPVIVLNETAARTLFPGEDPLGRRIAVGIEGFTGGAEIVGVVGDVLYGRPEEGMTAQAFVSHRQVPLREATLMVSIDRAAGDPLALVPSVKAQLRAMNPRLPVRSVATMESLVQGATSRTRVIVMLLGFFAVTALVLSAAGVYGVIAFSAGQRTREFAVRLALGARWSDLIRRAAGRTLAVCLIGIAAGAAAARGITPILAAFLYEIPAGDFFTFAGAGLVLLAAALAGGAIPVLRVLGIDPAAGLRQE